VSEDPGPRLNGTVPRDGRHSCPAAGSLTVVSMASLSWSPPARIVLPVERQGWPWRRGWIGDALDAHETVLVTRRTSIETVLCVDDGSPQLRRWIRRVTASHSISRVRCLGIVDVTVPWYAGIGFSQTELIQAVELATLDASRRRSRSAQAMARWLERRGVPAVAEWRQGSKAEIVVARARETDCDLIILRDDVGRRSDLRSIIERSECSVLVVRDGQRNGRSG
jgi:nucleotide-binding universal stress UspA family protein